VDLFDVLLVIRLAGCLVVAVSNVAHFVVLFHVTLGEIRFHVKTRA